MRPGCVGPVSCLMRKAGALAPDRPTTRRSRSELVLVLVLLLVLDLYPGLLFNAEANVSALAPGRPTTRRHRPEPFLFLLLFLFFFLLVLLFAPATGGTTSRTLS